MDTLFADTEALLMPVAVNSMIAEGTAKPSLVAMNSGAWALP